MIRTTTLLCATAVTLTATAQPWTVGQPVDMLLYTQPFYGGCGPDPDYTFTFPTSPVTGVDYKVIITNMVPANGSVSLLPGLDNGQLNDEFIFDATVQRALTLAPGTTNVTLEFRAQGIPEQAGQGHPCSTSMFWMSNMMFCPEGLTPSFNDGCTVQDVSTGVDAAQAEAASIQYPTSANGQQLSITLNSAATADYRIVNSVGRTVLIGRIGAQGLIGLSALPTGLYVLDLHVQGHSLAKRFLVGMN